MIHNIVITRLFKYFYSTVLVYKRSFLFLYVWRKPECFRFSMKSLQLEFVDSQTQWSFFVVRALLRIKPRKTADCRDFLAKKNIRRPALKVLNLPVNITSEFVIYYKLFFFSIFALHITFFYFLFFCKYQLAEIISNPRKLARSTIFHIT